jgi:hypothetical protein
MIRPDSTAARDRAQRSPARSTMPPADQAEKRVQPEEEEEEEDELRFRLMAMHRTPGAGGRTRNSKKKAICEPRRSLVGFTHDEPSTRGPRGRSHPENGETNPASSSANSMFSRDQAKLSGIGITAPGVPGNRAGWVRWRARLFGGVVDFQAPNLNARRIKRNQRNHHDPQHRDRWRHGIGVRNQQGQHRRRIRWARNIHRA